MAGSDCPHCAPEKSHLKNLVTVRKTSLPATALVKLALQTEMTLSKKSYARLGYPRDFQELMEWLLAGKDVVSSFRKVCLSITGHHWGWESVHREAILQNRNIPRGQHRPCPQTLLIWSRARNAYSNHEACNITILGSLFLFLSAEFQ